MAALGPELGDQDFARFRELIYKLAGILIPESKRVMTSNRIRRRLRATGIDTYSAYYLWITSPQGAAEIPRFLDVITTNETYFFRDTYQYDWFGTTFLDEITTAVRSHLHSRRLRIWSAACSTGEELYSIAMKIHARKANFSGWNINLFGSDLSNDALAAAKTGSYDTRSLRLVSAELRSKYFTADAVTSRWSISPEIKAMTSWRRHNLLQPFQEQQFDCIFLKNVMIYFDTTSRQTVVRHLIRSLAPGGYLVLGPTEGVHAMLDQLTRIKPWLFRRTQTDPPRPAIS